MFESLPSSLRAHLLISSGGLQDPNFRHTVVLIGHHDAEGAVGVVLNRPRLEAVAALIPSLGDYCEPGATLHEGGPVAPEQAVLLAEMKEGNEPDIPVLGNAGFLNEDLSPSRAGSIQRIRVFTGYSGWGPGQLEDELQSDAWIIEAARIEDLFDPDPESLWHRVLRRKGEEYRHISMLPKDPRAN